MKFLIMGRTASGKDTIARNLEQNYGLRSVISYTDRPRRDGETDETHTFISKEEMAEIYDDLIAKTTINGNTYGATCEQVRNADLYVIDPKGAFEIAEAMPDTAFEILFINADDKLRREHFIQREQNNADAEATFEARNADEDMQFIEFEIMSNAMINQVKGMSQHWPPNIVALYNVQNNYDESLTRPDAVEPFATRIYTNENIKSIIMQLQKEGSFQIMAPLGLRPKMDTTDDIDLFAWQLASNDHERHKIVDVWLSTGNRTTD